MGQTAIVTPQIIDSTSIGRDILTAADQAAVQTIIGGSGVDTAGDYVWTGDHTFDNGLSTDSITSTSLTSTYASAGSHTYTFGVNPKYFMNATNLRPATGDEDIALGIDTRRWASVASVDGDFSGNVKLASYDDGAGNTSTVQTEPNGGSQDQFWIDRQWSGTSHGSNYVGLRTNSNASGTAQNWFGISPTSARLELSNGLMAIWQTAGNQHRLNMNFHPYSDNTKDIGTTSARWKKYYGVDGSFSGSLNSEVGGSYKLYNLGTEGDADTEYIETSWGTNAVSIWSKATGNGAVRELTVGNADNRFRFTTSGVICAVDSITKLNIGSNFTYLGSSVAVLPASNGTIELGRSTARWQNVASVDGDFSGDVVMAANVDFTGLPTSDPAVAGRLWNDGGTMKISAG